MRAGLLVLMVLLGISGPTGASGAPPALAGRIVFASYSLIGGNWDIYIMKADGTDIRRLTDHPESDEEPSFSADGRKIAFVSGRDGNREIYIMNDDGAGVTRLTTRDKWLNSSPVLSPNGQEIMFLSTRIGDNDVSSCIFVMNVDGTGLRPLTERRTGQRVCAESAHPRRRSRQTAHRSSLQRARAFSACGSMGRSERY